MQPLLGIIQSDQGSLPDLDDWEALSLNFFVDLGSANTCPVAEFGDTESAALVHCGLPHTARVTAAVKKI